MRKCPRCSFDNADATDFCTQCGTYLRWEPTRLVSAVPAPPAETPAEEEDATEGSAGPTLAPPGEPKPSRATVTLTVPPAPAPVPGSPNVRADLVLIQLRVNDPHGIEELPTTTTEPGGQASVFALIRNQSRIVDNYDVSVEGVPADWWTAVPPTIYLVPFGSPTGSSEQEVELRFHPPRSAQAEARAWPIKVVVSSKAQGGAIVGSAQAAVVISPFEQLKSTLGPEVKGGRRGATYALQVTNGGNADVEILLSGKDAENKCTFEFERTRFTAEWGRRAGTTFAVRPQRQIWVGKAVDRRLEVVATGLDTALVLQNRAVFRQKPWIPRWALPLVALAGVAVVAVIALLPNNTTVPPLRGKTPAAAEAALVEAGLKLSAEPPKEVRARKLPGGRVFSQLPERGTKLKRGSEVTIVLAMPKVPKLLGKSQSQAQLLLQQTGLKLSSAPPTQRVSEAPAGSIVAQTPGTGRRVASGTEISIEVAVGSGLRTVPQLKGLTVTEADAKLREAGLSMAVTLPEGRLPDKTIVDGQLPEAGAQAEANEPVIVYPKPPRRVKPIVVPALGGLSVAAAAVVLGKLNIVPEEVRRFDTAVPAGDILDQIPPDGAALKPGDKLTLVVSAGYPRIVFSDGKDVLIMSGADGSNPKPLAPTPDIEDQPTWQRRGGLVAYRRGPASDPPATKIWIAGETGTPRPRALTAGPDDRRPAFSPDGNVIAYAGTTGTGPDRDLCFVRVAAAGPAGACKGDATLIVDRPAWSSDGRTILAVARDPANPDRSKLVQYTSIVPNSSRPSDWSAQAIPTTDPLTQPGRGVQFAKFSPDGTQVAIVANWISADKGFFQVFLSPWTASGLGAPTALTPPLRACSVAWRADSAELVVRSSYDCNNPAGDIERVDPTNPAAITALRSQDGRDPSWEPLTLSGG